MEKSNISAWDAMMAKVAGQPEIDRLRAEIAAMRPIVEAVASHQAFPGAHSGLYMCLFCTGAASHIADIQHDASCLAEQARAFVTAHPLKVER